MADPAFVQDLRRYMAMFHKRRAIIATCLGVSLLAAVLYNYTARPVYQATAQILIDRSSPKVLPTKDLVDPGIQDFQTEYELLRGRTLAEKVVERMQLSKTAEFSTGPLMSPWERFQRKFLGRAPSVDVGRDGIPLTPSASSLRSRLRIEPLPGGRLVNVRFLAYDPKLAAQVANSLCETYIDQARDFRFMSSTEATGWLSERLREQRLKVEEAEKALLDYQAQNGLAGATERAGGGGGGDKMASLQAAVLSARMDRIAKETFLGQVRALPSSQLASLAIVQSSPSVQALRGRVNELQGEQARISETLGDKHPEMVRLRGEIASAQDKLRAEAGNVVRALESDLRAARAREASLESSLEAAKREGLQIDEKTIAYDALRREVETSKELYQNLLARAKETGLETELTSSNVRIMERAQAPGVPISPRRMRNYGIALLVGLTLGLGLGLLFEHVDNTIKTPDEVKEQLGVPFLGMVPDVTGKPQQGAGVPTMALRNPDGPVAEAYRVLRTNLIFSSAETTGRAVVVTSANPGEGKTTTAANLAVALALNGAKVLVVDGDLRRPTLHQHFGVGKTPGLSDLIVGRTQASESIRTTRFKGLQVLACGYAAPNPAELLGSASMKQILGALRTCYDWVIVDTPPILAMADTPVLCPLVDGVVLVVAAESTTRPALVRALDQISGVGGKVTGVVLNKVDLKRNSYYYSQYYGEYYRSYYAEGPSRRSSGGPIGRIPARRS
jgi:succinoglycan biosynthesis transport protein ExoP